MLENGWSKHIISDVPDTYINDLYKIYPQTNLAKELAEPIIGQRPH